MRSRRAGERVFLNRRHVCKAGSRQQALEVHVANDMQDDFGWQIDQLCIRSAAAQLLERSHFVALVGSHYLRGVKERA